MEATQDLPGGLGRRLAALPTGDVVFLGMVVMGVHLALMLLAQVLTFRAIEPYIPSGLGSGIAAGFYGSAFVNVMMEAVVFFAGWMFATAASVLLEGRENARALFGWMALAYAPLLLYSAFAYAVLFLAGGEPFAGMAGAADTAELLAAARDGLDSGVFTLLRAVHFAAYAAALGLAAEAVHRVCSLPRARAWAVMGAYAALLLAVSVLTGRA